MEIAVGKHLDRRIAVSETKRNGRCIHCREIDTLRAALRDEHHPVDEMLLRHRMRHRANADRHLMLRRIVGRHGNMLLLCRIDRVRLQLLQRRIAARKRECLIAVDLNNMGFSRKIKY